MRYDAAGQKGSFRTGVNLALGPGATVLALVEVDAPLLYANRGHPMAKSCPPRSSYQSWEMWEDISRNIFTSKDQKGDFYLSKNQL